VLPPEALTPCDRFRLYGNFQNPNSQRLLPDTRKIIVSLMHPGMQWSKWKNTCAPLRHSIEFFDKRALPASHPRKDRRIRTKKVTQSFFLGRLGNEKSVDLIAF
jgi:hypothetical protein